MFRPALPKRGWPCAAKAPRSRVVFHLQFRAAARFSFSALRLRPRVRCRARGAGKAWPRRSRPLTTRVDRPPVSECANSREREHCQRETKRVSGSDEDSGISSPCHTGSLPHADADFLTRRNPS
jgi:hypothetical protein